MADPGVWGEMTSPEVDAARAAGDVVLIPVGAVEQHGSHLPVDTDIRLAIDTAMHLARRQSHLVVAPPVWWGLSANHRPWAGYLTLRSSTYLALLTDLSESLIDQGFRKIAFVVGHASNKPPVQMLVADLMQRHSVPVIQLNYINLGGSAYREFRQTEPGGDWHAGELETALVLHLWPDLVKDLENAAVRYVDPHAHFGLSSAASDILDPGEVTIGVDLARAFPEGVAGDPRAATAELGRLVFDRILERAGSILDEYRRMDTNKEND